MSTTLTDNSKAWLSKALRQHPKLDQALIHKACQYAEILSEGIVTPYDTSTLEQGFKMANLLLDLNCDNQTLAAAIIYPGLYYAQPNKEKAKQQLGNAVFKLAAGAERMEAIHDFHRHPQDLTQHQSDNLRKMLLSIVDDVRIVLIKLAERLTALHELKSCNPAQQQYIAKQCIEFYAPLANRLGIGQLKWQLEDLSFRYLKPEDYFAISKSLNMRRTEREQFIQQMMQALQQLTSNSGVNDFSISGRAKHIYSIYKKAERKKVPISEIYDASALRVLVPTIDDCYTVLSLVHSQWPHIQKEFDDYIANPKSNGYQSIHTAVITDDKHNVEIQIRTYQMHESAELGVAAHWKYKEGDNSTSSYEEKIARLREVMDWQKEITGDEEADFYQNIFADRIYVFTPLGDVFDLPAGSTPLDFAYHVHSAIGHCCKGAKVNQKMVPLTHTLSTGDRVEIVTSKTEHPSRDWLNPQLNYLKTTQARQKVRQWFKQQNYDHDLQQGQQIFDKAIRHESFHKSDLKFITKKFNLKKPEDILVALGSGNISIASIIQQLKTAKKTETHAIPETPIPTPLPTSQVAKKSPLMIEGVGNLLTQLGGCCKPIPGDAIVGYITKGRGVTIHQQDCPNIQHALLTTPQRIIKVKWQLSQAKGRFPVDLLIQSEDRPGLVRDISSLASSNPYTILGLTTRVDHKHNLAYIYLTVELPNSESLKILLNQIRQILGVQSVSRS